MLGLLLIYFIGKWHADLAFKHDRKKWVFAILGIAVYYAGTLIYGVVLGFILAANGRLDMLEGTNEILWSLSAIPFGAGFTVILYYSLKRNWERNPKEVNTPDLLDVTINNQNDEI